MSDASTSPPHRAIARVAVDMPLPHLDRLFDYVVPDALDETAQPGVRVRVTFAGRLRDGFVIERGTEDDPVRSLAALVKVVSPERVLTGEVTQLLRAVADHYAGCFADVMRLAVPPRHAATEQATPPDRPVPLVTGGPSPVEHYPTGLEFLAALARGDSPRAAWQVAPVAGAAGSWPDGFLAAAAATLESGRGALLVVPGTRDLARLAEACANRFGDAAFVSLSADDGPAARYRAFLAAVRGQVRLVIGTRAAAYAPVRDLGLVALWDDGDDLHSELRAPYPHVREVLAMRAGIAGSGALFAAHHRTCEIHQLLDRGWLGPLALSPADQRHRSPAVRLAGDSDRSLERDPLARSVRLPREVFEVVRTGLASGPVLVHVPRAGYLVVLQCVACRTRVRCPHCHGPVRAGSDRTTCDWCARPVTGWRCPACGHTRWRAPVIGAVRTAEELGHAFPGIRIVQSQGDRIVAAVGSEPVLVIATPGAEPPAVGGYAAAVLLDAELLLTRADLRAEEEAHRRWLNAIALVRPGAEGGTVIAVGPTEASSLQALVRGDPAGFAEREWQERASAHLTPAAKMIAVDGPLPALGDVADALSRGEPVPHLEMWGPAELPRKAGDDTAIGRLTLRVPLPQGGALVRAIRAIVSVRTAKKLPGALRVRVDPIEVA